jgi:hypothetical protein
LDIDFGFWAKSRFLGFFRVFGQAPEKVAQKRAVLGVFGHMKNKSMSF